jgi:hypothetical protein
MRLLFGFAVALAAIIYVKAAALEDDTGNGEQTARLFVAEGTTRSVVVAKRLVLFKAGATMAALIFIDRHFLSPW